MKLKDILKIKGSKVWTIREDQTVQEALHTLANQNIGALLVLDKSQRIVGIISERDIVRGACYNAKGVGEERVSELMTTNVIIGSPEDEVSYLMGVMTQNRVRHIPVVAEGKLEGIVSIGDVVKSQLEAQEYEIHYLKEYIYGRGSTP
ncbi:MAG: CBS domain-containing protein [Candidatus Omnitrophica bacterium]|nr:CBS domain-containing protein [Candidatus Omnitrophota bacterium]